jgi:stress-induced morphogen
VDFLLSGSAPDSGRAATLTPWSTWRRCWGHSFPDATELSVADRTGTGDHFNVAVTSPRFDRLSVVDQHRLVYDALAERLADGTIHELRITTRRSG